MGEKHSKCNALSRPMWFMMGLCADGITDINHKQHHHALPGLVVLTDLQAKAKRPFACITAQQCQWIDMLVRLLMRQHGSL